MHDWRAYVRSRLRLPDLHAGREAEIIEDLAQQLEDAWRAALEQGAGESEAVNTARREIPDWDRLAREITESETRNRRPLDERILDRTERTALRRGGSALLSNWTADLIYALRLLRKNPGFTIATVLTLALGIGANAAVFSIISAAMLRPLPFAEPDRLVRLWESNPRRGWPLFSVSQPNFLDWREQNRSFERLAASTGRNFNLTGTHEPERVPGLAVTADFFPMLGIQPIRGRNFLPEEDAPDGRDRVVLISHGLWQRRFGGSASLAGGVISLNEQQFTVAGILPQDFRWGTSEVFVPLNANWKEPRADHRLAVYGRLKAAVSSEQALAEMAGIAGRLALQYPESNGGWTVRLRTFYDWLIPREDRHALIVLLGAVAFLLLIACANVANLMLARATVRRREMAIRTALGAGRGRLVRQLLTESLLLSLLGCVLGLVFAHLGLRLAGVTSVDFVPRGDEISLDGNVLLFTLCISLLTGLLFGLVPALQTAHADMNATLKEGSRSAGFSARNRTRNILVVAETALALVLLIGIGLLLRSLGELLQVDPGYATRNLLTGQISLPEGKYPSDKEYVSFHRRLMERLQALPGVESASLASGLPLAGGGTAMEVHIEDRPPDPDGRQPSAQWRLVAPGYFRTMGIPLLAGRDTNDRDLREGDGGFVGVVISEEMARRYWPDQNPIGRRFHPWALSRPAVTIVGVVGNVRLFGLETQPEPAVYLNFAAGAWNPMFVVLRTALDPEGYAAALRNEVRALDPNLPVAAIRTMDEIRDSSLTSRRFIVILLGIFAVVALVLAAVGLFAVMAYLVAQRTHEIGLRLALGARSRDILRLIAGRGMMLTFAGIACGVAGGFALTRVMSSMLFGAVGARDPLTFSTTAALLAFVAFLACWIPARAAARVDPLRAIHHE